MKTPVKKVKLTKKLGIYAMILGWIPFLGWGLILYVLYSVFKLTPYIQDKKVSKDIKISFWFALIALFLIPLELIIVGLILNAKGV